MWLYSLLLIHCSLFGWAKDFSEDETASILLLDVPTYLGVEEGGVGSGLIFPCVYQKVFTIRFCCFVHFNRLNRFWVTTDGFSQDQDHGTMVHDPMPTEMLRERERAKAWNIYRLTILVFTVVKSVARCIVQPPYDWQGYINSTILQCQPAERACFTAHLSVWSYEATTIPPSIPPWSPAQNPWRITH